MVNCQNCGEEVVEGAKFCKNCGSEIVVEQANEKDTKFCSNCGFEMPKASKFCPECGTTAERVPPVMNTTTIVVPSNKSSGLAALLSFLIIGLGQVYLGLTKKGNHNVSSCHHFRSSDDGFNRMDYMAACMGLCNL